MALTKKDKKGMVALIADAINDVVVPALENMETRLASKEDIRDLASKIDSLDRKFDSQQERQDRHNDRIEKLEKIHPQGKHLATI